MRDTLYLDTARIGLMSPTASQLNNAFARLAGDPGGLLYLCDFVRDGFDALPPASRRRHALLRLWTGVDGLAEDVRRLAGVPSGASVEFASRSRTLVGGALRRLLTRCERPLTVDLLWPPYRRLASAACRKVGRALRVVRLRGHLRGGGGPEALATTIADAYRSWNCDGLFLPLVTHHGVELPVASLVGSLGPKRRPKAVVVDGSQALGHVPLHVTGAWCDVLVAGCHKWVGGHHPLALAIYPEPEHDPMPHTPEASPHALGDPLGALLAELRTGRPARHGETAAVVPLLSACGAVSDRLRCGVSDALGRRVENNAWLAERLRERGWRLLTPGAPRHGITTAKPPGGARRDPSSFVSRGVAVTVYRGGSIRFSLPDRRMTSRQRQRLLAACGVTRPASAGC